MAGEFRAAAREIGSAILSTTIPQLANSIARKQESVETSMSRSSDDLSRSLDDVNTTVKDINLNLADVNDNMRKVVGAMSEVALAVDKQNVSITKGFGVVSTAVTALLAAAGLSILGIASASKERKEIEPQTGLGTTFDSPFVWNPMSMQQEPIEDVITPAVATSETPGMAPKMQGAVAETTRVSSEPATSQTPAASGFIIPGTSSVMPASSVAPMTTTPKSVTSAANDNRSMAEIRQQAGTDLPNELELNANEITFSANKIVMKDRSRENRVSREIQALRDKNEAGGEEPEQQQQTQEQLGSVQPSMGLTSPYGAGAGSAGGIGSMPDSLKTGENGKLRDDQLADIGIGNFKANPKAAEAFKAMRAAAAAEGVNLGVSGAYRTYERQVQLKAEKGGMAATPGKSNHGWGLAFDMDFGSNMNSPGFQWMAKNAARFGIQGPLQSPFEPWHWEYRGGEDAKAMESVKQQTGAATGMGEGTPIGSASPMSAMPGQTSQPMMLPPSAGGGAPAMMMPPSVSTGTTLNRESVMPTFNSARQPTATVIGNPSPTSNPVRDASIKNPRIENPSVVGNISPELDRLAKVFSGWGTALVQSVTGR